MTDKVQKMNLSHWDIAVDFTGSQAAALALGIDPDETSSKRGKSLPLYQRMESCYNSKKAWLWGDMDPMEDGLIAKSDMLESLDLRWCALEREPGTWGDYCDWVKADNESRFEQQRFTRQELVRWLAEIKFDSQYEFGIDSSDAVQTIAGNGGAGTEKIWIPERLQKLAEYRAKHGTKKAATEFKISESRIRQLLPSKKPAAERSWGFPPAK